MKSFCVQPQDTPTMARIEAVFPCHLQLVHSEVRLVSAMDGKILGLWPFKCIRRYKFVGNLFSIEAGRKAPTGEGIFEFISNECSEIYRVMDTIIRTKAGSTTTRRLASEKVNKQIEQGHQPVRKVNSVPVSPHKVNQYDYANPDVKSKKSRPPPPSVPVPSAPDSLSTQSDPTYDILSPGTLSVDGNAGKQDETPSNNYEYNTLQFGATPVEDHSPPQNASTMAGSAGSYDTLHFTDNSSSKDETLKAKGQDRQYDTLQFGDGKVANDGTRFGDNELQHSSGSFYNTLDHASGSIGSIGSVSSNTYDCLHSATGSDTYDALGKPRPPTTLELSNNTYDALQHDNQKSTSKESPSTQTKSLTPAVVPPKPIKPPPRRKPPSTPKQQEVRKTLDPMQEKANIPPGTPPRKTSTGAKPEKPVKAPRRNIKEAKEVERPKAESISEVIQKRLANPEPPVDDGSYASVDPEYTSIDYSKVSRSGSADSSDIPVYADPDEDDIRGTPIPKPQQTKPTKPAARNNPKQIKNLFKKAPKPKADKDGSNFADELKKKFENKLKKTGHKPASTSKTGNQTGQSSNDEDIYDEVDDSRGPYYSEPDAYSEPAV